MFFEFQRNDSEPELLHIVTDHLGTPREAIKSDGEVVWAAQLQAWGLVNQKWSKGTSVSSPDGSIELDLRLPNQWEDQETGLSYNLQRYYDPLTGQYVSSDPIGVQGGLRPHGYVHNPSTWMDPLGLAPCAHVDNQGVLRLKNPFAAGSAEDAALQQHVGDWNQEIQNQGGSMTRQTVTKSMRDSADKAASAARKANPSLYPSGTSAAHTRDVGWGGNVQGPINPLNSTVNSYVGGATQGVPAGTTYNSVVLH